MAHWVRLPFGVLTPHIRGSVAPLPIQSPANSSRKTAEDNPSAWVPNTHVEDPDGVAGSWLQDGPVPVTVAVWGAKQLMSILSVLLCPTLSTFVEIRGP